MKALFNLFKLKFLFYQLFSFGIILSSFAQSSCAPSIIGVWEEEQDVFSTLFFGDLKFYEFSQDGKVEIFQFNSNSQEILLLGSGLYRIENELSHSKLIFSNLSVLIFKTEGLLEFPLRKFDDNLIEFETVFGFSIRLKKVPPPCKLSSFDENEEVIVYDAGGYTVEGSLRFVKLVRDALIEINSITPEFYSKYIHSSNYNFLKGIKTDCEFGVNHPNKYGFIELRIENDNYYNKLNNCIQILAGTILHEAVHLFQAYNYIEFHQPSCYNEFNINRCKSIETANAHERQAFEIEQIFFDKTYESCSCKPELHHFWCYINSLYNDKSYPDLNRDGNLDLNDFGHDMYKFHPSTYHSNCKDLEKKLQEGKLKSH